MKRKLIVLFLIVSILLNTVAFADKEVPITRISGSNRFETAVNISSKTFNKSEYVLLANGYNYVDALAASSLAAQLKAPILLTDKNELPKSTINEMERLNANKVILLGGLSTITSSIEQNIKSMGYEVSRLGGVDRYNTSELIFEELTKHTEIFDCMITTNEIDALASSVVRGDNVPLIMINKNDPSEFVLDIKLNKIVIGGELQIDSSLFNKLKASKRISGSNRYETAIKLAEGIQSESAIIVNSTNLVDAFTASSFAVANKYPILLSAQDKIDKLTKKHIEESKYKNIILLGGENMLSSNLLIENKVERIPKNNKIKRNANGKFDIDYSYFGGFNSNGTEWWFKHPTSYYDGTKATIEDYRKVVVDKHNALWQAPETGKKTVYLTFDEGYEYNNNTAKLLDIAKQKGVKFTFFLTDAYLNQSPEVVKRMAKEGHLVGNHSMRHEKGSALANISVESVIDEYNILEAKYEQLTGMKMSKYMRPPYGDYSEKYLAILNELGYIPVFWSFGYHDWDIYDQPGHSFALDSILKQIHDGSILLLHTVSNTNIEIMPKLIDEIKAKGYAIETIDKIELKNK